MGRFAEALEDARRLVKGDTRGIRVDSLKIRRIPDFTPEEIKALRHAVNMPQRLFALCLGVTQKSVEAWEGGRSHPDGAARRLLGLLQNNPDFFQKTGIIIYNKE
jgi:putative transcriptional regulator